MFSIVRSLHANCNTHAGSPDVRALHATPSKESALFQSLASRPSYSLPSAPWCICSCRRHPDCWPWHGKRPMFLFCQGPRTWPAREVKNLDWISISDCQNIYCKIQWKKYPCIVTGPVVFVGAVKHRSCLTV